MNFVKKIFTMFMAVFLVLNLSNVASAELQELIAEGQYRLGDRDSRETAKMAALADAKRKIIEQVGVFVRSYSELNKANLTQDQITTTANAMIKTKSEEVYYYDNGMLCEVVVVAIVDTENIEKYIDISKTNVSDEAPTSLPIENKPYVDKNLLRIAGFEEFNGHYYKVFNEGVDWRQASERCKELGGHLVTITSKEEQGTVQSLIFYNGKKNYYWTGGFRLERDEWRWETGEEFTYTHWGAGEPDNALGNEFTLSLYTTGLWNDCPANGISHIPGVDFFKIENSGFICEWESYDDIKN